MSRRGHDWRPPCACAAAREVHRAEASQAQHSFLAHHLPAASALPAGPAAAASAASWHGRRGGCLIGQMLFWLIYIPVMNSQAFWRGTVSACSTEQLEPPIGSSVHNMLSQPHWTTPLALPAAARGCIQAQHEPRTIFCWQFLTSCTATSAFLCPQLHPDASKLNMSHVVHTLRFGPPFPGQASLARVCSPVVAATTLRALCETPTQRRPTPARRSWVVAAPQPAAPAPRAGHEQTLPSLLDDKRTARGQQNLSTRLLVVLLQANPLEGCSEIDRKSTGIDKHFIKVVGGRRGWLHLSLLGCCATPAASLPHVCCLTGADAQQIEGAGGRGSLPRPASRLPKPAHQPTPALLMLWCLALRQVPTDYYSLWGRKTHTYQ